MSIKGLNYLVNLLPQYSDKDRLSHEQQIDTSRGNISTLIKNRKERL